jgi:C4-dicarboxylate-specific signal transduction histidine kinase
MREKWERIGVSEQDDFSLIRFIDAGRGIKNEVQDKTFQPFFSTKIIGEGAVVNLSLAKNLVERIGGELYYELYQGNTCFTLKLNK